jgi:hypothetical protein
VLLLLLLLCPASIIELYIFFSQVARVAAGVWFHHRGAALLDWSVQIVGPIVHFFSPIASVRIAWHRPLTVTQ